MSEFYVGWEDRAPPALGRWLRRIALMLITLAGFVGGWLAAAQAGFDRAAFEFGAVRTLTGIVIEKPYPMLLVERPFAPEHPAGYSRYLLSGRGKHGAQALVAGLDGALVEARGELIYRDAETMLKLVAPPTRLAYDAHRHELGSLGAGVALGAVTLRGEIVDPQCFYGLMRPGRGIPHRACAIRCLAGGVPPVLYVPATASYVLITGPDGSALSAAQLGWIAEPVELRGQLYRHGALQVLHTDPASIRRFDTRSATR